MQLTILGLLWTFGTFNLSCGYEELSATGTAYQSSTATTCSSCVANYAIDKIDSTCTRTEVIGTNTGIKTTWWYVDLGAIRSLYNIRILFKDYSGYTARQRGRFAGFSLYVSNTNKTKTGTLCYKNGQQLPPLDFNINCFVHGQFVIYHNERLDGTTYPSGYEKENVYTELCEVTVTGCAMPGVFGDSCNKQCPNNCQNRRCSVNNGNCLECTPGWVGGFCNNTCPFGSYGLECKTKCPGHCKNNASCNHITGTCDNGCTDGWTGETCTEACRDGTFGPNCTKRCSDLCPDDNRCFLSSNGCNTGCDPGYTGDQCDKECIDGRYGRECAQVCSPNCKDICNNVDGACSCKSGWKGITCSQNCESGRYGINCAQKCSTNCDNSVCHHVNGTCLCKPGWKGSNCTIECTDGTFGQNCLYSCSKGCLNDTCHRTDGECSFGCRNSFDGPTCVKQGISSTASSSETNMAAIAAGSGIGFIVIAIIIVGILIIRWKRNKKNTSVEENEILGLSSVEETWMKNREQQENESTLENPPVHEAERKKRTTLAEIPQDHKNDIVIGRLSEVVSRNKQAMLAEEYRRLPKGALHPCTEGKRRENSAKNRYTTIFPYDHSRVILDTSTGESDYINASYIQDALGKKTYIATQGPKRSTIDDFWRMVWQENARVIVCLTNVEANNKKCSQYWPNLNAKIQHRGISVLCQQEKIYAEHIIRHLRLQNAVDNTEREVFMFHYTGWPEEGVPETLSLVVFHRQIMKTVEEHPWGYIIVHCSAGISRTGTLIALDALYKEGDRTGKVNVPKFVENMRNNRMNMIKGDEQYRMVYMALLESFRGHPRAIPAGNFPQEYHDKSSNLRSRGNGNKSPLAAELKELLSIRKEYTQEDYLSGRSNITANFVPSVLPVETYLCPITNSKEEVVYYNAVSVPSYTKSDLFISAQYPLPDFTEDFLSVVMAYNVTTIVSLYPLEDIESTFLWMPNKNENKTVGNFTVKMSETLSNKTFTKSKLVLNHKGGSSMSLALLECKQWQEGNDVTNRRVLIDLIKEAEIYGKSHPDGRILVLSSDGATRCGPFCVVFNALEQMRMDNEIDLFTLTRQLQTRRPEFLSSLEDYTMCYDTVAEYLQNDTVYSNC